MGCSSSKSIIIKDLNSENELKEENEEIIDKDVKNLKNQKSQI